MQLSRSSILYRAWRAPALGFLILALAYVLRVDRVQLTQHATLELGLLALPLSLLLFVTVPFAFRGLHQLPGLAERLSFVPALALLALSVREGSWLLAGLAMLPVLAATWSSLRGYAFGKRAALLLGLTVASACAVAVRVNPRYESLLLPLLACGLPILDLGLCVLRRVLERRRPWADDRSHVYHLLLALGRTERRTRRDLFLVSLAVLALSLPSLVGSGTLRMFMLGAAVLLQLGFFWALGVLRVRRLLDSLRSLRAHQRAGKESQRAFEDLQLRIREAKNLSEWWGALCLAADTWNFARLEVRLADSVASERALFWTRTSEPGAIEVELPFGSRRSSSVTSGSAGTSGSSGPRPRTAVRPHQATLAIAKHGTLESAADPLRYFARLLDEPCAVWRPRKHSEPPSELREVAV